VAQQINPPSSPASPLLLRQPADSKGYAGQEDFGGHGKLTRLRHDFGGHGKLTNQQYSNK
jgi:hypothetical protein